MYNHHIQNMQVQQSEVYNGKSYFVDIFGSKVNWNMNRWYVEHEV